MCSVDYFLRPRKPINYNEDSHSESDTEGFVDSYNALTVSGFITELESFINMSKSPHFINGSVDTDSYRI